MVWNGTGTNTIITIVVGTNELTNGLLSTFFLLLIFGIVYFLTANEPTREGMTAATFVTMIVAILGRFMVADGSSFVNDVQLGVCVIAFLGAMVMLFNR